MLGYGDIWIIPEFVKTTKASLAPMQLITIERTVESKTVSMVTEEQIIMASRLAYQILHSKRNGYET